MSSSANYPMRQQIAPPWMWWMLRGYQLLAVIIAPIIGILKPPRQSHEFVSIVLVAVLVLLVFDMFARGTASAQGITFTRYRDEHYVPWRDVEEIVWSPKAIRVKLRDRHFLRRYAMFPLHSSAKRGFAFAFGRDVPEPPFIAWLNANGYLEPGRVRRQNRWTW